MQPFTVLVFSGLFLLSACAGNESTSTTTFDDSAVTMQDAVTDTDSLMAARYAPVSKRFKSSEIINSAFPTAHILGTWTHSLDEPGCDFLINAQAFMYCDYDGNGERLYRIEADSIFLDEAATIRKGRILIASGDTLAIRWDELRDMPDTLIRWRN
ncbi:hypothetical protein F0L74_25520 [Chitinophaga agrisoli]|uniref:Lipocalin-like protein n=1 Tax=Chitinophaga agrisoli TaxID=2607653 RepID=A0A5B2VLN9_9BACT|nr:hypothetical protein [Chitinophaga agrisoli]KAA2239560.1 hypothetical protein F0L74_25520 [Chitinophaga agrisoli]